MDNLLFYTLLILIAYYFLVYSKPTRPDPQPTTHSKSTQTDPIIPERTTYEEPGLTLNCPEPTLTKEDQTLLENTLDQLIKGMNELNEDLDKM